MSIKGIFLIIIGLAMVVFGAWVLATGASYAWVTYVFAILWAVAGVVAIDYFGRKA